jgi:hypothetical protein
MGYFENIYPTIGQDKTRCALKFLLCFFDRKDAKKKKIFKNIYPTLVKMRRALKCL